MLFLIIMLICNINIVFNFAKNKDTSEKIGSEKIGKIYNIGTQILSDKKMEWICADIDKENVNKILLVTKDIVDAREYNKGEISNYKNSSIRYYLNKEFYNKNFTNDEKKHILMTEIKTNISEDLQETINDRIFLPSKENVQKYKLNDHVAKLNEYTDKLLDAKIRDEYWLRDKKDYNTALMRNIRGNISSIALREISGIRPMMWYDLSIDKDLSDKKLQEKDDSYIKKLIIQYVGKIKKNLSIDKDKEDVNLNSRVDFADEYEKVSFGFDGENDIDWYILDVDKDKVMLLSQYILDFVELEYNTDDIVELTTDPYEHSNIKTILNDKLYNKYFSKSDKEMILKDEKGDFMRLPNYDDMFRYGIDRSAGIYSGEAYLKKDMFYNNEGEYYFLDETKSIDNIPYFVSYCTKTKRAQIVYDTIKNQSSNYICQSGIRPIVTVDRKKFEIIYNDKKYLEKMESKSNKKIQYMGTIQFGKYEQDGNEKNGKEKIDWKIVKKHGDSYLLISDMVLDEFDHADEFDPEKYSASLLRQYSNTDFLNIAFTKDEIKKLNIVFCCSFNINDGDYNNINYFDTYSGQCDYSNNKVFSLGFEDAIRHDNVMYEEIFDVKITDYLKKKSDTIDNFMMRDFDSKYTNYPKQYVKYKDSEGYNSGIVGYNGFRPMICLKQEDLLKLIK